MAYRKSFGDLLMTQPSPIGSRMLIPNANFYVDHSADLSSSHFRSPRIKKFMDPIENYLICVNRV